jgi:hypothetical protein
MTDTLALPVKQKKIITFSRFFPIPSYLNNCPNPHTAKSVTAPHNIVEADGCGGEGGLGGGADGGGVVWVGLKGEAGLGELDAVVLAVLVLPLLTAMGKSSKLIAESCGCCRSLERDFVSLMMSLLNSSIFMVPLRPSLRLLIML